MMPPPVNRSSFASNPLGLLPSYTYIQATSSQTRTEGADERLAEFQGWVTIRLAHQWCETSGTGWAFERHWRSRVCQVDIKFLVSCFVKVWAQSPARRTGALLAATSMVPTAASPATPPHAWVQGTSVGVSTRPRAAAAASGSVSSSLGSGRQGNHNLSPSHFPKLPFVGHRASLS